MTYCFVPIFGAVIGIYTSIVIRLGIIHHIFLFVLFMEVNLNHFFDGCFLGVRNI